MSDDLNNVLRRLRDAYPDAHGSDTGVLVKSLHEEISGRAAPMLRMLLAAVAVMLLVACANIANLFLMQGSARRRELAVRAAIGASRGRIISQLITEAVVLGLAGGALGVLVARGLVRGLIALGPTDLPRVAEIGIDWKVALFTLGVSLGASLLVSLAPAFQSSSGDLRDGLKGGDRTGTSRSGRLRAALIFAEVALSTLLLISAALLGRSFQRVTAVDPGFRPSQVLTIRLSLPRARYKSRIAIENFYTQLHPRIAALPGVRTVAASNVVPMNGYLATTTFFLDGVMVKDAPEAHYRMVSPDYFRALDIQLRAGRPFTPADRADSLPVAIVNETFARQYRHGASPIGARMRLDDGEKVPRTVEVVGVIGDVKHFGLEKETTLEVYVPISQVPEATTIWLANNMYWVVETDGAPLAATNAVRREIAAVDPGVPASFVRSMDQWMGVSIAPRRFNLTTGNSLCGGRVAPRRRRRLCDGRISRVDAHARDRHPRRAGGLTSRSHPARASERPCAGAGRACGRNRRGVVLRPRNCRPVIRCRTARSGFARDRGDHAHDGCPGGKLPARTSGRQGRSHHRAPSGVRRAAGG